MNRHWGENDKPVYCCRECGRQVFVSGDYLPRHRIPKERKLCPWSESHTRYHKLVRK